MADGDDGVLLLQMSADVRGIQRALEKARGETRAAATAMQRDLSSVRIPENPGVAKAIQGDLVALKSGFVSTAGSATGLGNALGALGPAGIGAAAGFLAIAAALRQAREAVDFADELGDTAGRLHVTTDALQEYRFALRAAGGESKDADEALGSFNSTLGKAQEGLPKAVKGFKALGLDPKQFNDGETALKAVIEQVSKLKNDPQKDAIIDQLGLTGMKPLIEQGTAAVDQLRAHAHEAGNVMDAELVQRGGELKEQLDEVGQKVDVQLKSAFISLGPVLVGLLKIAGAFAGTIAGIVDNIRSIENRSIGTLRDDAASNRRLANGETPKIFGVKVPQALSFIGDSKVAVDAMKHGRSTEAERAALRAHADALDWEADKKEIQLAAAPPVPHGPLDLGSTGRSGGARAGRSARSAPSDRSEQIVDAARKALASALEQAASSQLSAVQEQISADSKTAEGRQHIAADIDKRASIEQDRLKAETEGKLIALSKLRSDTASAEKAGAISHANADQARAAITLAERTVRASADEQAGLITRHAINDKLEQVRAAIDRQLQHEQEAGALDDRILAARQTLATTEAERADLGRQALVARQRREDATLKAQLDTGQRTPAEYADLKARQDQAHSGELAGYDREHASPLQRGRDEAAAGAEAGAAGLVQGDDLAGRKQAEMEQIRKLEEQGVLDHEQANRRRLATESKYLDERTAGYRDMFAQLAELSSSGNKRLAAIGKAAAIAEATMNAASAVIKALDAPFPLNLIDAGVVSALAAVQIAKISGVSGFEHGGYTGNGGRQQVAGVVHGQEFVVNAKATAANRSVLEALNAGQAIRVPTVPSRQPLQMNHSVRIAVDVTGANGDEAVRRIAGESAARAAQAAYEQAIADVPARMEHYQRLGS